MLCPRCDKVSACPCAACTKDKPEDQLQYERTENHHLCPYCGLLIDVHQYESLEHVNAILDGSWPDSEHIDKDKVKTMKAVLIREMLEEIDDV